ncbi:hypothetical protein GEV33_001385 [Tenebrio molitor]|uniref:Uncharacterized protein n=1 Tax=Tenebrio molitor TaxID=7067 RepID=A0A8J6LQ94_TENMO|nr:hypothetical protein GEV33_001385 [Tenebrio molitor]
MRPEFATSSGTARNYFVLTRIDDAPETNSGAGHEISQRHVRDHQSRTVTLTDKAAADTLIPSITNCSGE